MAKQVGWQSGYVPTAQVTIRRSGSGQALTRNADDSGSVQFDDLLPGTYFISAVRLLSAAESDRLALDQRDVNGFGGAGAVDVRHADLGSGDPDFRWAPWIGGHQRDLER